MAYLRLIPYIIILIFMIYIGYKEYDNHKKQSSLKDEIISLQNEIVDFKEQQHKLTIELLSEYNRINQTNVEKLNEKINVINANVRSNNDLVTKLHTTTKRIESDWDTYSDATKTAYIQAINDEFRRSTNLLTRIAESDDRNYEIAVTYYNMLLEYHNASKEYQNNQHK